MVHTSLFLSVFLLVQLPSKHALQPPSRAIGLSQVQPLRTTSGVFQGKQVNIGDVSIRQFFGIPYGEKPVRFQRPLLRSNPNQTVQSASERTAACPQAAGGLSYGPFHLSDMYDEDCLTLNIFLPESTPTRPRAMMVFCHGGANQVGSGSLFDGSAIAALGDIIVITINYRLNVLGFLASNSEGLSGNYGLYDQLLALQWVSINAERFHGDAKRITYVGHSTGAANALLLAMSTSSNGLIARVIAQSGGPLHRWAVDREPSIRLNNVLRNNGMKSQKKLLPANLDRLKTMRSTDIRLINHSDDGISSVYPYPVVDQEIVSDHFEQLIRNGPLTHVDLLIGANADESVYFTEQYGLDQHPSDVPALSPAESTLVSRCSYFRKAVYIQNYLKKYYPNYLCYYDEIQARYGSKSVREQNVTEPSHLCTDVVSDLTFYYDLMLFLRERLASQSSASTYVYYHTYPSVSGRHRTPSLVSHFAELDLLWGVPFLSRPNGSTVGKISYTPEEIELSVQMIRYWSNFVKTGNPNEPQRASVRWPAYEAERKSYINFHARRIGLEENFLEERFQFWDMLFHRPICTPFYWYHTALLIGILVLVLVLIFTFIFHNTKRSRRNIKPIEMTTSEMLMRYQYLPSVVS